MLRFHHIFALLLVVSAATAFVVPRRVSEAARPGIQAVFAPVARPAGAVGGWLHGWLAVEDDDGRLAGEIRRENLQLQAQVANLSGQLEALRQLHAERAALGPVLELCEPFVVVGADAGGRDVLSIRRERDDRLRERQAVLAGAGLVGRVERLGVGGAEVRLVTDRNFPVSGAIARWEIDEQGQRHLIRIPIAHPMVTGAGGGMMMVSNLPLRELEEAGVRAGDWIILNDRDWPLAAQGQPIGRIVEIVPLRASPLFAEMRIQPLVNLMQLREVMVLTR